METSLFTHLTFRTITFTVVGGLVGLFFLLFIIFQARYVIVGPQIAITNAPIGPQNERRVFLEGTAQNISRLWLNDRPIYTDPQGNFKEAVILENGYTISTLRAEDRYGRETRVSRTFVYAPTSFLP